MSRSGVVLLLLSMIVAIPAAAADPEWTIDPPAGWRADAAAGQQMRDQIRASKVSMDQLEVQVWRSGTPGAGLIVQRYVEKLGRATDPRREIDELDRGMVHGVFNANPADTSQQVVGDMVIRDVQADTLRGANVHARMVRRYQPAKDGLHVLMTMCTSTTDLAPCAAALDSVHFTVADPIPLAGDRAYRAGYYVGRLILPIIGCVIALIWLMRRRARRRLSGDSPTQPRR